jgi:uncharacterized glyoxalase superfamily protein PhnB
MSDGTAVDRIVSTDVVVACDPATAFDAFTGELDLWWQRGPINFYSPSHRVAAVVMEPHVGGRIIEVLTGGDGEVYERARITEWEPGARVAWADSDDDVKTDVRFEAVEGGTRVVVEARIPADGVDRGGTAWTRVVPGWFGAWCASRDHMPKQVVDLSRLALAISYERPAAAARFLADAFGFGPRDAVPEGDDPLPEGEHGHPWIEFRIGNGSLMLFPLDGARSNGPGVHVPWIYVDDVAAHLARAEAHGATIVERSDVPWSGPTYVAEDTEGNRWTFLQARPTQPSYGSGADA